MVLRCRLTDACSHRPESDVRICACPCRRCSIARLRLRRRAVRNVCRARRVLLHMPGAITDARGGQRADVRYRPEADIPVEALSRPKGTLFCWDSVDGLPHSLKHDKSFEKRLSACRRAAVLVSPPAPMNLRIELIQRQACQHVRVLLPHDFLGHREVPVCK